MPVNFDKLKFPEISPVKWAILVTIVFGAVQLPFSSFMADDFMQLGILEGVSPCTWLGPMDVYTLADGNPAQTNCAAYRVPSPGG